MQFRALFALYLCFKNSISFQIKRVHGLSIIRTDKRDVGGNMCEIKDPNWHAHIDVYVSL